jgi:hypothetical protein
LPVEVARGPDEVTLWLWPNKPDPLTVRLSVHEWAKVERKAERVADGDLGRVIGQLLDDDLGGYLEA